MNRVTPTTCTNVTPAPSNRVAVIRSRSNRGRRGSREGSVLGAARMGETLQSADRGTSSLMAAAVPLKFPLTGEPVRCDTALVRW